MGQHHTLRPISHLDSAEVNIHSLIEDGENITGWLVLSLGQQGIQEDEAGLFANGSLHL